MGEAKYGKVLHFSDNMSYFALPIFHAVLRCDNGSESWMERTTPGREREDSPLKDTFLSLLLDVMKDTNQFLGLLWDLVEVQRNLCRAKIDQTEIHPVDQWNRNCP